MIRWIVFVCSVCGGDPGSDLTKAALAGVVFLGGVVLCVLGAILATAVTWVRRAHKLHGDF